MNNNDSAIIQETIDFIRRRIHDDCERHYQTFIFEPRFFGETPGERYTATYCSYEAGLIGALEEMLYREDELPDPDYSDGPEEN